MKQYNRIAEFKKNVQCAFQKGFEDVFGKCEETILPEKDIDQSLNGKGSVAYERWEICRIGTGSGRIREGSQVGVLYAFLWAFFIGVFMGHHEIYNESRKRKGRKYDTQIILLDVEVDWR